MELINRDKLIRRMDKLNVSQRELARAAGWKSHSYMRRLITGEAKTLNTDPALRIAHYLHLDVDDIFVTRVDSPRARVGTPEPQRRVKTAA
ncbi:XRE family transcriptional regulator [Brachybacterium endophyticum]|uniref:XRE family transcriptional regulator n=2 Tax=Brachybacterium endophyticum TaxID=2182385 RepID=A0A2U2RH88_9MICO|nr:XRE family transcriptional regulator [Brachybacterium endophyticum]